MKVKMIQSNKLTAFEEEVNLFMCNREIVVKTIHFKTNEDNDGIITYTAMVVYIDAH